MVLAKCYLRLVQKILTLLLCCVAVTARIRMFVRDFRPLFLVSFCRSFIPGLFERYFKHFFITEPWALLDYRNSRA